MDECDACLNNVQDEDGGYYCAVDLDEDEMARFLAGHYRHCPYFEPGDEYKMVRRQN